MSHRAAAEVIGLLLVVAASALAWLLLALAVDWP